MTPTPRTLRLRRHPLADDGDDDSYTFACATCGCSACLWDTECGEFDRALAPRPTPARCGTSSTPGESARAARR